MVLSFFTSNPAPSPASKPVTNFSRGLLLWITAAVCVIVDQATKEAAFRIFSTDEAFPLSREAISRIVASGEKFPLVQDLLWISPRINPGAAFSLLSKVENANLILMMVSLFFITLLIWLAHKTFHSAPAWAFGLLIGGSIGNLLDRFRSDGVLDFIHLGWWPTFNIADAAIVFGVVIMILWIFFYAPTDNEDNKLQES